MIDIFENIKTKDSRAHLEQTVLNFVKDINDV